MTYRGEALEALRKARWFVLEGCEQILNDQLDEKHAVSPSPGATALATLALLALGRGFEIPQQRGARWLWLNRQARGWGKVPEDAPDEEITRLAHTVVQSSQGGWVAKVRLLSQARQFSTMILSLGQRVVPGLEGPTPEEIRLPRVLDQTVLAKLPPYGRPVVVAAALLAVEDMRRDGIHQAVEYLFETQMPDGSWSEDIVATSIGILALARMRVANNRLERAGHWLVRKQYASGAWAAFDQLHTWAVGWAVNILAELDRTTAENDWFHRAGCWLRAGQNLDGSYGTTPPFTHPDLDDTAVALMGLHQVAGMDNPNTVRLLKRLQNDDGSWGTFPSFDGVPPNIESTFPVYIPSVDVTVHVLEALWRQGFRTQHAEIRKGLTWLLTQQQPSGEFPAVWFEGPIYGTAQTVELLSKWRFSWEQWLSARQILMARKRAYEFLGQTQNCDGSWGSSVVETALALSALGRYERRVPREAFEHGIKRLIAWQRPDGSFQPAYGGIYAKGWNYEEPLTTALTAIRALERYCRLED